MRRVRALTSWLLLVASFGMFLAIAEGLVPAQSGRRAPKAVSPAPPPPQPQPSPPVVKAPPQAQISVLVLTDISQSLYLSVPFPERVQRWVSKRLRDSSALSVMEGESANRSEAIKRAKASKDTFVIFLKVDETGNSPTITRNGRSNLDDVSISYNVFTPTTGKAQSSGVVYLSQRSSIMDIGRIRTAPICYPGVRGNDLLLLQASLEVAGRILSALGVKAGPICGGQG